MKAGVYTYNTKEWPIANGCCEGMKCAPNCWAKRTVNRLAHSPNAKVRAAHEGLVTQLHHVSAGDGEALHWTGVTRLNKAHLTDPLHWRKPQRVAVAYHGDLFRLPDIDLLAVFAVMGNSHIATGSNQTHQFLLLTKQAKQMRDFASRLRWKTGIAFAEMSGCTQILSNMPYLDTCDPWVSMPNSGPVPPKERPVGWMPENIWFGVSCEDQTACNERILPLLQTPAAKRWVSLEPMVGAVDLRKWLRGQCPQCHGFDDYCADVATCETCKGLNPIGIDWVVLGGESGPGARPMHPDWARSVRGQCAAAGVPFWFKQWGAWQPIARTDGYHESPFGYDVNTRRGFAPVGKRAAGRLLDGREHLEMPEVQHA